MEVESNNTQGLSGLATGAQCSRLAEDTQTTTGQYYLNQEILITTWWILFSERLGPQVCGGTVGWLDTNIHYMECQDDAFSC